MQSLCLIVAMLGLQYLLIKYKRPPPPGSAPKARRPFNFWQWCVDLRKGRLGDRRADRPSALPPYPISSLALTADDRDTFGAHVEFLAGLIVVLCAAYLVLGSFGWFIDALGFVGPSLRHPFPSHGNPGAALPREEKARLTPVPTRIRRHPQRSGSRASCRRLRSSATSGASRRPACS